jgi:ATP/maltotriose-dependent transcriptional regulator MalT
LAARADHLGDPALRGRAAMLLGAVTWAHLKDTAAAESLFRNAQCAFEDAGDAQAALTVLPGLIACLLGRKEGLQACAQGVEQARRLGQVQVELLLLNRLTEIHARLRRHAQALAAAQRQARLARHHGMSYHLVYALWNQGYPLARLGRAELAAQLMAFSARWWVADFGPLQPEDERYVARVREAALVHLDAARWQALWARGQALPAAEGIALGSGPVEGPGPI